MKRFFLITFTTALVFLPAILFAQTTREPAYNIVITPITFAEPELKEDSSQIYESVINEFGWQGQLNNLYRLIETQGGVGEPPAFANLPPDAQAADPRYVLTVNLYIDGSDRVVTMNLYDTPAFNLIGNQELAYRTVDDGLGQMAFFCWSLSSNLPADDRPVEAAKPVETVKREIIYVSPEEDISWKNKWLYLGLQGGFSFRLYKSTGDSDSALSNAKPTFDAGLRLEGQFVHFMVKDSYFSFSAETGADISQEKLNWTDYIPTQDSIVPLDISEEGSSGLSLAVPLVLKFNYKPNIFSASLYGGAYYILPLDGSHYSLPLGITGGVNAGVKLGPGFLYVDFQYGIDLGVREFRYEPERKMSSGVTEPFERDVIYKRQMFNVVVGYKFGFFGRPDRRKPREENGAVEQQQQGQEQQQEQEQEPPVETTE